MGLRPSGRYAQRRAISTVLAIHHLVGTFEIVLGCQAAAIVLVEVTAFGNAEQRVVCLEVLAVGEVALVGRDERQVLVVGDIDELRLDGFLLGQAVALELDVEAVAEDVLERLNAGCRNRCVIIGDRLVDGAVRAARERDQPLGVRCDVGDLGVRRFAIVRAHVGTARNLHEIAIAGLAHRKEGEQSIAMRRRQRGQTRDAGAGSVRFLEVDGEADADDRLDAGTRELVGKFQRPEQIVGVGERDGRKAELGRAFCQCTDRQGAFEQRISRMHLEVHEGRGAGRGSRGNRLCHGQRLLQGAPATNAAP